ncbi:MAG: hypothetical protein Q8876_03270 [Bacillota bacterium]|nr:hypothetical protein [Bacillota bacterium]
MRLKTLLIYYLDTLKLAVIIFYSIYIVGSLLGSVSSAIASRGLEYQEESVANTSWSMGISSFAIFMFVLYLIFSMKSTRFLISRSVSRKEIFLTNVIALIPISAVLSILQIISIYLDGFVRFLFGSEFRGLSLDVQSFMAPNMNNIFVFFTVSFSIIICSGVLGYLLGSFMVRWKIFTISLVAFLFVAYFACVSIPSVAANSVNVLKFMFTDSQSGVWIAVKLIAIAAIAMIIAFPVMRKITAVKQTQ